MSDFYFSTGQVAEALKASPQTIRRLCLSGQIKAERSAGGHFRIAPDELERLRQLESLPPAARAILPQNDARPGKKTTHELLGPPSPEVIQSAEAAYVAERDLATDDAQLRRLRVHKEATELTDYFAERRQRILDKEIEAQRLATEREEKQRRESQAQIDAERREEFMIMWMTRALTTFNPVDAPQDFGVIIYDDLRATLEMLPLATPDLVVEALVNASIARSLRPSRAAKERTQAQATAVKRVIEDLPLKMRWNDDLAARARKTANDAVHAATDASVSDLAGIAKLAVHPLVEQFEHREKIHSMVDSTYLAGGSFADHDDARKAVETALRGLPVGADERDLEEAKEKALAAYLVRIEARRQQQQEDAERQRLATAKQRLIDHGMREIFWHAEQMLHNPKFDYDRRTETAWAIEARCRAEVAKALAQLTGDETNDAVMDLVHGTMEELEE